MKFVMLECPSCGSHSSVSLVEEAEVPDLAFRCPVAGCAGWVSQVEAKAQQAFWGCGECGSTWKTLDSLEREIAVIVAKFPYRKKSYRKNGKHWLPGDVNNEAKDLEKRVAAEPPDTSARFQRD